MTLDLTIESLIVFVAVLCVLLFYSTVDIRRREVPNQYMVLGAVVAILIAIFTGTLYFTPVLAVVSIVFAVGVSLVLFRVGAFGGADAKALIIIGIASPGVQLGVWSDPFIEGIVGIGGQVMIALTLGYVYSRLRGLEQTPNVEAILPLIPFLTLGYALIQLLAFL
ncbi:MAG: prepilin peptidase [Candidatus Hodarchaeota archaeon]